MSDTDCPECVTTLILAHYNIFLQQELAQACWARKPEDRPSDDFILFKLREISRELKIQSPQGGDDHMTQLAWGPLSSVTEPAAAAPAPPGYVCPPAGLQGPDGAIKDITGWQVEDAEDPAAVTPVPSGYVCLPPGLLGPGGAIGGITH